MASIFNILGLKSRRKADIDGAIDDADKGVAAENPTLTNPRGTAPRPADSPAAGADQVSMRKKRRRRGKKKVRRTTLA